MIEHINALVEGKLRMPNGIIFMLYLVPVFGRVLNFDDVNPEDC